MTSSGDASVNLCILGAFGYMASNALSMLREAKAAGNQILSGVQIKYLIDPRVSKPEGPELIEKYRSHFAPSAQFFAGLGDLVNHGFDQDTRPLLFYDASPPRWHFSHLETIHELSRTSGHRLVYLGEKPFVDDPSSLARAASFSSTLPFFCEFIETENPVVHRVREHIERNRLSPSRIMLWRAGSSGLKKLIRADRPGVQGGSLLDKAPHDLSITAALLGPQNVVHSTVVDSRIHEVLLHVDALQDRKDSYLSADGEPADSFQFDFIKKRRGALTADGMLSARVQWWIKTGELTARAVDSEYLFSWCGVLSSMNHDCPPEATFMKYLERLQIPKEDWLYTEEERGPKTFGGPPDFHEDLHPNANEICHIQEARIGIIECGEMCLSFNLRHMYLPQVTTTCMGSPAAPSVNRLNGRGRIATACWARR